MAKSWEDSLNLVNAVLNLFYWIKSRYFSCSKSCLYLEYKSSRFELLIVPYQICVKESKIHCFIREKGILISVCCGLVLSPTLATVGTGHQ